MNAIQQLTNYLIFGNVQSNHYFVWVSGTGTYDVPERDITTVSIAGRNGDLILDNGRFKNINIVYPCFISREFDKRFDLFKAAMMQESGYRPLIDTYHPEYFRLATFIGAVSPDVSGANNKSGTFELEFNCLPQRFLTNGTEAITITADTTLTNPTGYEAKPLIRVYGYGTLGVGSDSVIIAQNSLDYIDLDCETMDGYCGGTNANSYLTLSGDTFPTLGAGTNGITLTGSITKVDITPRWWTV